MTHDIKKSTILEEIEEFVKSLPPKYKFQTGWFQKELSRQYNRPPGSYIPSDSCYNRKNKGINFDKQPHYFLHIGRGKYEYVGKDYIFTGEIEEYPKNPKR